MRDGGEPRDLLAVYKKAARVDELEKENENLRRAINVILSAIGSAARKDRQLSKSIDATAAILPDWDE